MDTGFTGGWFGPSLDGLVAELTEAAYPVALRHGVKASSVDVEVEVWQALRRVVGKVLRCWREVSLGVASRCEELVARLTDAVYQVALRHGFRGSFLDLELDLWRVLRRVLRRGQPAASAALATAGVS